MCSTIRSILTAILITLPLFIPACRENTAANEIIVSAAVSLKDAFNEIAEAYEQRSASKILFNFGASGALQKQIESGAPVDVFASAGAKQMDELAGKELIIASSRADFVRNLLVLVAPADSSAIASFTDLTKPEIKKIAVGNPKTVPAGQYTEQTFDKLQLLSNIRSKLISAEDVRQVLNYVARGEVDAGVIYSSDMQSAGAKVKEVIRAPEDSHDPILYPIAIVKDSKRKDAAQKFIDFVLSSEGQTILAKHGFLSTR